jgi:hypothetical protein
MRKAIKLCLALAMACTMAVPAFAGDTTASYGGEVDFFFSQTSNGYHDATGDVKTYGAMDMSAEAGFWVNAENKGDVWTTTASIGWWGVGGASGNDGANISMANDAFKLNFGTGDLGDATKNSSYFAGTKIDVGDELTKGDAGITFSLPDAGFAAYLAMNHSGNIQTTAYAVSYDMVAGAIDFSFEYEALSKAIDETKTGQYGTDDGRTETDLGIGVAYDMDPLTIKFNYGLTSLTQGGKTGSVATGDARKSTDKTNMMLSVDFKLDDTSGAAFNYTTLSNTYNNGSDNLALTQVAVKTDTTRMGVGYKTKIGAISVAGFYQTEEIKSDKDAVSDVSLGVTGQDMYKKAKTNTKLGLEMIMGF